MRVDFFINEIINKVNNANLKIYNLSKHLDKDGENQV